MIDINDYKNFNNSIAKCLYEKAFFCSLIDNVDVLVDFGCGNGHLIRYIDSNKLLHPTEFIGHDNDVYRLAMAESNSYTKPNMKFTISLHRALSPARAYRSSCVNFSSVLYETAHHNVEEFTELWNKIARYKPRYITIRDMFYQNREISSRSSVNKFNKIDKAILANKSVKNAYLKYKEKNTGQHYPIMILNFLLKYNWNKEDKKNYFPEAVEDLETKLLRHGYKINFKNVYVPSWINSNIQKDFGIDLKSLFTTHGQYVFERG